MNKPKILMLLTRIPYPIDNGRKSIIAQTIEFLMEGYDIHLLIFSTNNINANEFYAMGISSVQQLVFPSKIEMIVNSFRRTKHSLQENMFFSHKNCITINDAINRINPDVLYADMIRTAQFIEDSTINKIVDIDDLLSERYKRYFKSNNSPLLGTFNKLLPSFVQGLADKVLKKTILKFESATIEKREIELTKKFDSVFLVSSKETAILREKTKSNNIFSNTQAIKQRQNIYKYQDSYSFIFIGNMLTAQNLSSLEMIINEYLPKVNFKYKLFVVGKYDSRTQMIASKNGNIHLLGFVDNLEDVLMNVSIAFMPISFGTGIKTKILDCMSYGIPVLTNNVGNEGLATKHLENIILTETNTFNSDETEVLLNDKAKLQQISLNGHKYIEQNHCFHKLKDAFIGHITVNS